jgi:hypothetical protein
MTSVVSVRPRTAPMREMIEFTEQLARLARILEDPEPVAAV